jgi:hypothetical protein
MVITIYREKMQGKFTPKNPGKYLGNPTNIIYRSKWEFDLMRLLDSNPDVVCWGSEEVVIPYRSPLDNRIHRYFTDFIMKNKKGEVYIIEVKPFKQTQPPVKPSRQTKRFVEEVKTYAVNQAKWKAADEYCKDKNYKFIIMTENEIYGKK